MGAIVSSKSAQLYRQVRRALRAGGYSPGQRIDPGKLADEYHISPTPVRLALARLVGEGLIADHAREGLHVPLPTEVALRDLYDWMQRLLLMACNLAQAHSAGQHANTAAAPAGDDTIKRTWQLFEAIGHASNHGPLRDAIRRSNDRLAPIRRAKQHLIEQPGQELARLEQCWHARDLPALEAGLCDYHQHRKQLVPRIVAHLGERNDSLP